MEVSCNLGSRAVKKRMEITVHTSQWQVQRSSESETGIEEGVTQHGTKVQKARWDAVSIFCVGFLNCQWLLAASQTAKPSPKCADNANPRQWNKKGATPPCMSVCLCKNTCKTWWHEESLSSWLCLWSIWAPLITVGQGQESPSSSEGGFILRIPHGIESDNFSILIFRDFDVCPFMLCGWSKEGGSQDPSWARQAPQYSSCFRTASWYQLKGLWSLVRTESNFKCHQYATVNMQWITWKRERRCPATASPGVHFGTVTRRPHVTIGAVMKWTPLLHTPAFFCIPLISLHPSLCLQVALPCRHRLEHHCGCVFVFCRYSLDRARSLQDLDEKEPAPEKSMGPCGSSWLILILSTCNSLFSSWKPLFPLNLDLHKRPMT